ncbi:carboxypeptidase-like regulatory domain-containing protein [Saccharibacillus alkalitolerans]|uniref:Uncharacterized protein n=1 Tax=Saccharibacillus alkalitolerans TaxID=2705290 RepID=A0ABX0F409_9BACL|nr:carboxypeptidase-like regulatory domain-containing protein [Saccharibacillus alkalitolerans]NGZ74358.1 hypothetical protein [Saccharibacillus alkalitolerans]
MKIKLKVKHLVLGLLVPAVVVGSAAYAAPSLISAVSNVQADARGDLLNKLNRAKGDEQLKLIRENVLGYAQGYSPYLFDAYFDSGYVFNHISQRRLAEDPARLLTRADRIPLLRAYVERAESDIWLVQAADQLAYVYDADGRTEDGDRAIELALARANQSPAVRGQLLLLQAGRLLKQGQFAAADSLLEADEDSSIVADPQLRIRFDLLRARAQYADGHPQEALDTAHRGLKAYNEATGTEGGETQGTWARGSGDNGIDKRLARLERAIRHSIQLGDTASSTLTGVLKRSDGTPIAGAGVFLLHESEMYIGFGVRDERPFDQRFMDEPPYRVLTDDQGRFEIKGVMPGIYQINLGVSLAQADGWTYPINFYEWFEIKGGQTVQKNLTMRPLIGQEAPIDGKTIDTDTVELRWKEVPGASYYRVMSSFSNKKGTGTTGGYMSERFQRYTKPQASVPVDRFYRMPSIYWSFDRRSGTNVSWDQFDPKDLLGFSDPDALVSWTVNAYDAQDRLIASSYGYRLNEINASSLPTFYLKRKNLSDADRLLLERKWTQAIETYRSEYEADGTDTHAVRMLADLLYIRSYADNQPRLEREAVSLLEEANERQPNMEDTYKLMSYFYERADWARYEHYYTLYVKLLGRQPDYFELGNHAMSLLKRGRAEEAQAEFSASLATDPSHHYAGPLLALKLQGGLPLDEARKLAESYPEFDYAESGYDWQLMLIDLETERANDPAGFDAKLREGLKAYAAGEHEALAKRIKKQNELPALNTFLKRVLQVQ